MKPFFISKQELGCSLLLGLALTTALSTSAHAQDQLPTLQDHAAARGPLGYTGSCDRRNFQFIGGIAPSSQPRSQSSHLQELGAFSPRCTLTGDASGSHYVCVCEEGGPKFIGTLKNEDIFPGGVIPEHTLTDDDSKQPGQFEYLTDKCHELFNDACGPFPQDLEVECGNEHGSCDVKARASDEFDQYRYIESGCICEAGQGWVSVERPDALAPFSQERAEQLCEAELANCAPSATAGPSDLELLPDDNLKSRKVVCTNDAKAPDEDFMLCTLIADGETLEYSCKGVDGEIAGGNQLLEKIPTRAELHQRCVEFLNQDHDALEPFSRAQGSASTGTRSPKAQNSEANAGCSVATFAQPMNGVFATLLLALGGMFRRESRLRTRIGQ